MPTLPVADVLALNALHPMAVLYDPTLYCNAPSPNAVTPSTPAVFTLEVLSPTERLQFAALKLTPLNEIVPAERHPITLTLQKFAAGSGHEANNERLLNINIRKRGIVCVCVCVYNYRLFRSFGELKSNLHLLSLF